jgi:hypothetical protein
MACVTNDRKVEEQVSMAHACNPSYLGKKLMRPYLKKVLLVMVASQQG